MWMQNKRSILSLLILLTAVMTLQAQMIEVTDFKQLHKSLFIPLIIKQNYTTDKHMATIDFFTPQQGFTFKAGGKTDVAPEEGDGFVTLLVPDKTSSILISHPTFGSLWWRVPGTTLRKKKHYTASILTTDPSTPLKVERQWVILYTDPANAIVTVDSTLHRTRSGYVKAYLPVGEHTFRVESPFYEEQTGSFNLTDSSRLDLSVKLQPAYSRLSVTLPFPALTAFVDGIQLPRGASQRLAEGPHRVTVRNGSEILYDKNIRLEKAEKRTLKITKDDLVPLRHRSRSLSAGIGAQDYTEAASLTLVAPDSITEILIDREPAGIGEWSGSITAGSHALQTRREGVESPVTWIGLEEGEELTVELPTATVGLGNLNVSCNVIDAEVWIGKALIGHTPCVITNLPAHNPVRVRVVKRGYRDMEKTVTLTPNSLTDINFRLKKK